MESGINTLNESTGAWEGRHLMDVASEHGWRTHPGLVLDFYNERRREIAAAKPKPRTTGCPRCRTTSTCTSSRPTSTTCTSGPAPPT